MRDALINQLITSLNGELQKDVEGLIQKLEAGNYKDILKLPTVRQLLDHNEIDFENKSTNTESNDLPYDDKQRDRWTRSVTQSLETLLQQKEIPLQGTSSPTTIPPKCFTTYFLIVAVACMNAFLQSNVTGPPLDFRPEELLLPKSVFSNIRRLNDLRRDLRAGLAVDGVSVYELIPHLELFRFAKAILDCPAIAEHGTEDNGDKSNNVHGDVAVFKWTKLRLEFLHQRLLTEVVTGLQAKIFENLEIIERNFTSFTARNVLVEFTLERAAICNHYGLDGKAQASLVAAAKRRDFQFKLTGVLGKRTKYQQEDVSQLVVLARSGEPNTGPGAARAEWSNGHFDVNEKDAVRANGTGERETSKPIDVDLNDDTLLDRISFKTTRTEVDKEQPEQYGLLNTSSAPITALDNLDPGSQPLLEPLDSAILLLYASSITNTSPSDGITREQTLPFALRVLQGGSSNWQIYSQALLLRSRIEGYSSRTTERGLLQLQALVDQVIVELTPSDQNTPGAHASKKDVNGYQKANTFLPTTNSNLSAPVAERLRYIWLLSSPSRWELEAELAARWVSLGGLKSALEIYERLEMWPEIALCWAGIERKDKARRVLRRQLYHKTSYDNTNDTNSRETDPDQESYRGPPRQPPPLNAPRLYCILGDIDHDPAMYEAAWIISNHKYARAQRSLGRHYFVQRDFVSAAEAYRKALKVSAVAEGTWFTLGCAYLELKDFEQAIEAFSRVVQLNSEDAEAWSNLAAALLHLDRLKRDEEESTQKGEEEEVQKEDSVQGNKRYRRDNRLNALKALKHAASLKYDNFRIWENLLTVATSTFPPSYTDIVTAQTRLIEIRGQVVGERAVDVDIVERLVGYVMRLDEERQHSSDDIDINANAVDGGISHKSTKVNTTKTMSASKNHGIQRLTNNLVTQQIIPLITSSSRLWNLASRFFVWKGDLRAALDASEKAWRCTINTTNATASAAGGKMADNEERWNEVVTATIDLVDAYESLGPTVVKGEHSKGKEGKLEVRDGEEEGEQQEELVAKDWRFKARSALRSVMGKGKENWEGTEGWERLVSRLEEVKITKG